MKAFKGDIVNTFQHTSYGYNTWRPLKHDDVGWTMVGVDTGSKPIQMVYKAIDMVVFKVPGSSFFAGRGDRSYGPAHLSVEGILHEDQTEIKTVTIVNIPVRSKPIDVEQWRAMEGTKEIKGGL